MNNFDNEQPLINFLCTYHAASSAAYNSLLVPCRPQLSITAYSHCCMDP